MCLFITIQRVRNIPRRTEAPACSRLPASLTACALSRWSHVGDRLLSRSPRLVQGSGLDEVRGDLATFARSYAIRRNRAAWLLGAGASAMSGIPTAAVLTFQFKVELYCSAHGIAVQELDSSDPGVRARVEAYFDGRNGMPPKGHPDEYAVAFAAMYPSAA